MSDPSTAPATSESPADGPDRDAPSGALARTESRFRMALSVAELGAWELDLTTQQAWRDHRHDRIFGYDDRLAEWTYEMFVDHVLPADRERVDEAFRTALATVSEWDFSCRIRRVDGEQRWIAARGAPVTDDDGKPIRLVGFVRDITREREAEEALRRARDEAQRASRAKSEFLAMMSHELRTPLNAIGGYTELLEVGVHGPITDAQRTALERIQYSQRHLLGLISDVLNYARVESGKMEYDAEDVPVGQVLEAAGAMVAPQAEAAGLRVTLDDCPADLALRADPDKLRQILVNLLGNAVKFSKHGGRIVLTCEAVDGDVLMKVRDTGIGIPPDQMDAVFDPFVQVQSELTRTAQGAGLGLAISRDLARAMGGDLTAESALGVGSTFTLRLPAASGRAGHLSS